MPSTTHGDVLRAIVSLWQSSGLDAQFRVRRTDPAAEPDTLHEDEAAQRTPFPYCVWSQSQGARAEIQSWSNTEKRQLRDSLIRFVVYAKNKTEAEALAGLIEGTYTNLELCKISGRGIIMRYRSDFGAKVSDDEYRWVLDYDWLLDAVVNP